MYPLVLRRRLKVAEGGYVGSDGIEREREKFTKGQK